MEVYNKKIIDVQDCFNKINQKSDDPEKFKGKDIGIKDMVKCHAQGIASYKNHYILTHSNTRTSVKPDIVHGKVYILDKTTNKFIKTIETPDDDYDHPGGFQIIGDYAVIPVEKSKSAIIRILNLTDNTFLNDFKLETTHKVGAAGICNYTDEETNTERYLLGLCNNGDLYLYKSNAMEINNPLCNFTYAFKGTIDKNYQAISLLTSTGNEIYMIGYRMTKGIKDYIDLITISIKEQKVNPPSENNKRHMTVVHKHAAISGHSGSHFRWAGGIEILSNGSLDIFAGQRNIANNNYFINKFCNSITE